MQKRAFHASYIWETHTWKITENSEVEKAKKKASNTCEGGKVSDFPAGFSAHGRAGGGNSERGNFFFRQEKKIKWIGGRHFFFVLSLLSPSVKLVV